MECEFRRGLDQIFVDRLNKEYNKDGWWKKIADHPKFTIGIRNNYLNVYHQGNNILLMKFDGDQLICQTHYKYILSPSEKSPYITWDNGKLGSDFKLPFINSLNKTQDLIAASIPFSGEEKEGVDTIICANPNVVDVEIALTGENQEGTKSAKRIDLALFQETDNGVELRFFEAKHFNNKELRAKNGDAPVLRQIGSYEELIQQCKENLLNSYLKIVQNLVDLNGESISSAKRDICKKVIKLGSKGISISNQPRLIIFGFDMDQKNGAAWRPHREKLQEKLGSNRLLMKGNPENLTSDLKFEKK
ncbi:MAG: hypothetical protein H7839_18130 [Magnetococcus sp. YQC-5]